MSFIDDIDAFLEPEGFMRDDVSVGYQWSKGRSKVIIKTGKKGIIHLWMRCKNDELIGAATACDEREIVHLIQDWLPITL